MKKFSLYILLFIVIHLLASCGKKMAISQSVESAKKAFIELYKMQADTCIQLDSVHFLFTRMVERPQQGDGDSTYVYVLRCDNDEWSPLLSKGLIRGMSYPPVVSTEVVYLEDKEYLYMEYDFGGGSMGNNWTDFILYDLKDTMNEYTLSFEYYPPNSSTSSFIETSENLKHESPLYQFLYGKVQNNERFQKSIGATKTEESPLLSGWRCYGLLGQVKSVKYADGSSWDFNEVGNIIKNITVWADDQKQTQVYIYQSPTEYVLTNEEQQYQIKYKIEYGKNTRTEIMQDGEPFQSKFIFDKQGRLIQEEPNVEFDALVIEYKYNSEKDNFPYKKSEDAGFEGGGGALLKVSIFEYLKTDIRGNWTERKVTCKTSGVDEQDKKSINTRTYTEKREITYFEK